MIYIHRPSPVSPDLYSLWRLLFLLPYNTYSSSPHSANYGTRTKHGVFHNRDLPSFGSLVFKIAHIFLPTTMTKRSTTATNSNDNNNNHSPTNKRIKMADGGEVHVNWGDWMGSYKTGNLVDNESERIDRQKAAFGGDTIARLKDLNVLIVGMQGVGVETAKNLILSNVGAVMVCDPSRTVRVVGCFLVARAGSCGAHALHHDPLSFHRHLLSPTSVLIIPLI